MRDRRVALDAIGCCAMTHAFLRHPAHVRELGRNVGQFQVFFEIFQNTLKLSFVPNDLTTHIYRAFATAEIARLNGRGSDRLLCRHGRTAHTQSLEDLLKRLPEQSAH